ncbi:MAG: APC family permease [Gemmatimonadota bacterium]
MTNQATSRSRRPAARPLLRILGLVSGLAIAVGGTIGSGIFRTPGLVVAQLGSVELIFLLWGAGSLVFVCGALSYAELGSRYPESGGLFTYIRRAYGQGPGFVYGWLFAVVTGPASAAALAVVFGEYAVRLADGGAETVPLLAAGAILLFGVTNWIGLRVGAGVQNVLTAAKVLGLGALVVVAFLHPAVPGAGERYAGANALSAGLLAAFAIAFQSVIWAFDGFSDPLKVGEEIHDPERNVPRSLVGGVLVIGTVYLLVNAAFVWAVPLETMARSNLVAGEAAGRLFGASGEDLIAVLAIVAVVGTLNESLLVNPRIAHAMAREGLIFGALRRVNEGGTPSAALAWNASLALLFALSGTFEGLQALVAFALALGEVAAIGSLFVFRRRHPDQPAPFRVPGYPYVPLVFLVVNLAVAVSLVVLGTREALIGTAVIVVAALSYVAWRAASRGPGPGAL